MRLLDVALIAWAGLLTYWSLETMKVIEALGESLVYMAETLASVPGVIAF